MKKTVPLLSLVICLTLLLSACNGYNAIMRDNLGNISSYTEYECVFVDTEKSDDGIIFIISLSEEPTDNLKYENAYNEKYQTNITHLEMILCNEHLLSDGGFFDEVKPWDSMSVKCSPYIYMDTNFFYLISVKVGDKVYWDEETGLANMIEMMDNNNSLF